MNQRKRRASEIIGSAPAAAQSLREARLARAELTFKADDLAAVQKSAQTFTQAGRLHSTPADEFDNIRIKDWHSALIIPPAHSRDKTRATRRARRAINASPFTRGSQSR